MPHTRFSTARYLYYSTERTQRYSTTPRFATEPILEVNPTPNNVTEAKHRISNSTIDMVQVSQATLRDEDEQGGPIERAVAFDCDVEPALYKSVRKLNAPANVESEAAAPMPSYLKPSVCRNVPATSITVLAGPSMPKSEAPAIDSLLEDVTSATKNTVEPLGTTVRQKINCRSGGETRATAPTLQTSRTTKLRKEAPESANGNTNAVNSSVFQSVLEANSMKNEIDLFVANRTQSGNYSGKCVISVATPQFTDGTSSRSKSIIRATSYLQTEWLQSNYRNYWSFSLIT